MRRALDVPRVAHVMRVRGGSQIRQPRHLLFQRVETPGVEAVEHEQHDHNDQPKVGKASLLLPFQFLLVNLREEVDKDHRQGVGSENRGHCLEKGNRSVSVLQGPGFLCSRLS